MARSPGKNREEHEHVINKHGIERKIILKEKQSNLNKMSRSFENNKELLQFDDLHTPSLIQTSQIAKSVSAMRHTKKHMMYAYQKL